MPLYLTCVMCGRKQADGLLSRASWGHAKASDGAALAACPTCKTSHPDWHERHTGAPAVSFVRSQPA